ncbi:alpha/beta hydrolase [Adhaeribacter soli]|uniref:Lysophospholipase n=1 Tax=Adhaeribacter soli TaxID=2607655 RepID=A0A5N1IK19_9BACT|nr:alpha/beta fold hydrolase [Adhaeribacter soli]KAA9324994.1 lysophospholipase [Adhaeribacter soli]
MLFFQQESLIFFPSKLPPDHAFHFRESFQERYITAPDGIKLHGLLFPVEASKGLIFYLHGNAGSVEEWGSVASIYTNLGYDVFMLDYRGYGKSGGKISSEQQFYDDVQAAYDLMKQEYPEEKIIVLGYSIGTAAAARTAALNKPQMLILQAPYYSLTDLGKNLYPIIPSAILKYKFKTYEFVEKTAAPIVIFHGDQDEVIYYGSSLKLQKHLKPTDQLNTLKGQSHNGMTENPDYLAAIRKLLQ